MIRALVVLILLSTSLGDLHLGLVAAYNSVPEPAGVDAESGTLPRLTAAEREAGWQLLFNGIDSRGWRSFRGDAFPEQGWKIANGVLQVEAGGQGGDIITEAQFQDFEFAFEWKVTTKSNSGVMYRVSEEASATYWSGPEYQVLDDAAWGVSPQDSTAAGGLYALYPCSPKKQTKPLGQFNQGRIVLEQGRVEHWLNGVKVLEAQLGSADWQRRVAASKFSDKPLFGRVHNGHIALQDHGDSVWYRNLKIRRIPPRTLDRSQAIELFNGADLTGWTHHLQGSAQAEDVWRVQDGVLVCSGSPAGYLRTTTDYEDYVLYLEWRFSPVTRQAGNSGVLLRMNGPDKVWPRSIEAQLMSGRAGDFWNIGEMPMKVDPKRTRGRNTRHTSANENPVGEWNSYLILVNDGTVHLRVNGVTVNEAHDCLQVPGKICLQSEGAEIHFKDILLWPLDL